MLVREYMCYTVSAASTINPGGSLAIDIVSFDDNSVGYRCMHDHLLAPRSSRVIISRLKHRTEKIGA